MRKAHILEPATKTETPKRVIYFDTESEVDIEINDREVEQAKRNQADKKSAIEVIKGHDPYLVCATFIRNRNDRADRHEEKDYTRDRPNFIGEFWNDVDRFVAWGTKVYMFAHNAKYDTQVINAVPNLVDRGYVCRGFSDSNPFILRFEKCEHYINAKGEEKTRKKKIIILSSTNYFAQPLAKLGELFNLPKLDFNYDRKIDPSDPDFMRDAITYCRRDVEILTVAMLSFMTFVEKEGFGKFKMTVAGQSFEAFRSRFYNTEIYIHDTAEALEVERRAYAGGRNECFSLGAVEGLTYYVDINSMYPFVMKNNLFPTRLISFWKTATIEDVTEALKTRLICADCFVQSTDRIFHKKQGKLIFPVGGYWTTLSTPEIVEGLKRGIILECKNVCIYEGEDIFSSFVDFFYTSRLDARANGNDVYAELYKLIMNSLYGKFGQKNENWEVRLDADGNEIECDPYEVSTEIEIDSDSGEYTQIKTFGGRSFKKINDGETNEAFNSFPAVAAHVTAYARQLLFHYMEVAEVDNVHYCDTDSLFVNGYGFQLLWLDNALDEKRLGALKLEKEKAHEDFYINGCKDYHFAGKTKIKGVSKNARFLGENEKGQLTFAVTQWGGFAKRLKLGNFNSYHNTVIIKTLKRNYDKGTRVGNRVEPFELSEARHSQIMGEAVSLDLTIAETDYILYLCRNNGFIRPPKKGERYFGEYVSLNRMVKLKYFRLEGGSSIDEWTDENRMTVAELFDRLSK